MASRPLLHLLEQMIEEKGGDEYILDQVASNVPGRKIIEEFINPQTGKPFTRAMLYYWKDMNEERAAAFKEARRISAHNLMEDAAEDIDKAESGLLTPADVQLLKEKNGFRQYLAERYNREDYGKTEEKAGDTNLNISLGDGFLAALRQYGNAHRISAGAPQPEALPAEIVEDGDV